MRAIRRRNLARPEWTLQSFASQFVAREAHRPSWLHGVTQSQRDLREQRQSPIHWAARVPEFLRTAGLPGQRTLSSAEFQAWQRWEQALDLCASLGFDGQRKTWHEFLSSLARILDETLFAPESTDAPVQITGPAESAGLDADALWFLGADEEAWPASGSRASFFADLPATRTWHAARLGPSRLGPGRIHDETLAAIGTHRQLQLRIPKIRY